MAFFKSLFRARWPRRLGAFFCAALALFLVLYGVCVFLSYRAADVFNYALERRSLFPGTVTVERLTATPRGEVSFEGLRWVSPEGVLLADLPEGSFQVRPLDVILRRISAKSVTRIFFNGGYLHLIFDERMQLTGFTRPKDEPEKREKKNALESLRPEAHFASRIEARGLTLEAEAPGSREGAPRRHFTIGHADFRGDIDTKGETSLNLSAGQFTGTVDAEAIYLTGLLDFRTEMPRYDLYLELKNCDPESLDVGMKLRDKASLKAHITGDLPSPHIEGTLSFELLRMPPLDFKNVVGEVVYEDGYFDVRKATAELYGGEVEASGYFDLDARGWGLTAHGENIKAGPVARESALKCRLTLDLSMEENRAKAHRHIEGSFRTGEGSYHILPFDGLSGSFEEVDRRLTFRDVLIKLAAGEVKTDILMIERGHLSLAPVYFEDEQGRQRVYEGK